jgi:hypothetical protein
MVGNLLLPIADRQKRLPPDLLPRRKLFPEVSAASINTGGRNFVGAYLLPGKDGYGRPLLLPMAGRA